MRGINFDHLNPEKKAQVTEEAPSN